MISRQCGAHNMVADDEGSKKQKQEGGECDHTPHQPLD